MGFNFLSNKGSLAPYIYLFIQVTVITGIVLTCPDIIDFKNSAYNLLFWLNLVVTVGLFFYIHFLDPGYVPHDGVFFTDQEEPPMSMSHSHQFKYDSMMKLRPGDSKIISPGYDFSPNGATDLRFKAHTRDKSISDKSPIMNFALDTPNNAEGHINLGNSTQLLSVTSPLPQPIKEESIDNNPQSYDERYKNNEDHLHEDQPDDDRVQVSLSQEEGASQEDDLADLQAVIEGGDPEDEQIGEEVPTDTNQDEPLDEDDLRMKTEEYIKSNELIAAPTGITIEVHKGVMSNSIAGGKKGKYVEQLDDIAEEGTGQAVTTLMQDGKSPSPKKRFQTFEQSVAREQPAQIQNSAGLNTAAAEMQSNKKVDGPKKKKSPTCHRNGEDTSTKETRSITAFNGFLSGRSAIEVQTPNDALANTSIKLTIGDYRNMQSLISEPALPRSNNDVGSSVHHHKKSENEGTDELYIERRYCTACNLEQPLRSKHCRDCRRCVGRYDHHCPWTGTCIGELNHKPFLVYLLFQFIESIWGETIIALDVYENAQLGNWKSEDIWRVLLLLPATFFVCMVGSLMIFHFYLATQNLTTWEYLSWHKISYLKEWQTRWGSPFTRGFNGNLKFFFGKRTALSRWKMPKFRGPVSQQNIVHQAK